MEAVFVQDYSVFDGRFEPCGGVVDRRQHFARWLGASTGRGPDIAHSGDAINWQIEFRAANLLAQTGKKSNFYRHVTFQHPSR